MIGIAGAGAFGTALAITYAGAGKSVMLWARDRAHIEKMARARENAHYLPGAILPKSVSVTADVRDLQAAEVIMLAVPMQQLTQFLITHATVLDGHPLIACCKGMDLQTGLGPIEILAQHCPRSLRALLTGPGFAEEIARGLPTALTLAGGDADLQALLSTPTLRLYRTNDVIGAELGGALKNVIAIAAGVVTGAGLGASARAALLTRGFSEMVRVAVAMGGRAETLSGLSGLGDLVLTASSEQSRNFRFGIALGRGQDFDPGTTVEGAATALAIADQAQRRGVDLPLMTMVAALVERKVTVSAAIETLFSRPLKEE